MNKDKLTPQEIFQKSFLGKSITPEERAILRKTLVTPQSDSISGNERIKDKNENKARMGSKLASSLGGYVPNIELQRSKQSYTKQTGGTVEEENQQRFFQKGGYTGVYKTRNGKQPEIPIKRKSIKSPRLMKNGSYINESDIITNLKVGGNCHKCGGSINMQTGGKACGCRHKQKGGQLDPIFVEDMNDPKYQSYSDSLKFHDLAEKQFDNLKGNPVNRNKLITPDYMYSHEFSHSTSPSDIAGQQLDIHKEKAYGVKPKGLRTTPSGDVAWYQKPIQPIVPTNTLYGYMQSKGIDPSYSNRQKLAKELGIDGYQGSFEQNKQLRDLLANSKPKVYAGPSLEGRLETEKGFIENKQLGGVINESDVLPIAQNGSSLPCHKCGGAHKPYQMCYGGNVEEFKVIDEQDVLPLNDSNRFATRTSNKPVGFMYSKTITQ